jgi:hypothetical protein
VHGQDELFAIFELLGDFDFAAVEVRSSMMASPLA